MKKSVLCILIFTFLFTLCGCDTFKDAAESFKTEKTTQESHLHNHKDEDEEDTSVNLNFKVVDDEDETTLANETTSGSANKNETTTRKNDSDAQYPYTNVNDGDDTVYEWPKEGLALEFPELKSGTMKKTFITKTTFSVYYANVDPVEFDKYLNTLRQKGFTVDDTIDTYLYVATNDKVRVEFFYDTSKLGNNTLSLVATYID